MKTFGKFSKFAVAASVAGALTVPAAAAHAETSKGERAVIGAVLGGLAGAAIGNGKTEGVAIGAALGAGLGIATDKDDHNRRRYSNRYRTSRPYSSYNSGYRYQQPSRGYYNSYAPVRGGYYDQYGRYHTYR